MCALSFLKETASKAIAAGRTATLQRWVAMAGRYSSTRTLPPMGRRAAKAVTCYF